MDLASVAYDMKELVQYFKQEAPMLQVCDDDFKKPNFERLSQIYRFMVSRILNVDERVFETLPFNRTVSFEDPELFNSATPRIILLNFLNTLFLDIFDNSVKFSPRDIFNPIPKRTVLYVSALVRLQQVIYRQEGSVEEIIQKFDLAAEEQRELKIEIDKLKAELNELTIEKGKQKDRVKALNHETRRLNEYAQTKTQALNDVKNETDQLESQLKSEQAAMAELQAERAKLEAEAERLSADIVTSPDKLEEQVGSLRGSKNDAMRELEELSSQVAELRDRNKNLKDVEKKLKSMLEALDNVDVEMGKKDLCQKEKERLETELKQLQLRYQDAQRQLELYNQKLKSKMSQLDKASRIQKAKINDLNATKENIQSKIENRKQRRTENQIAASGLNDDYDEIEQEIRDLKQRHQDSLDSLNSEYNSLLLTVDKMNADMGAFYKGLLGGNGDSNLDEIDDSEQRENE